VYILTTFTIVTNCVLNNITTTNSSVPSPTTELRESPTPICAASFSKYAYIISAFPTFYSQVPTPSEYIPSNDNSAPSPLSIGGIIGIAVGVPFGIFLILLCMGACCADRAKERRKALLRPYWVAKKKENQNDVNISLRV
jgi:hypothetical protein